MLVKMVASEICWDVGATITGDRLSWNPVPSRAAANISNTDPPSVENVTVLIGMVVVGDVVGVVRLRGLGIGVAVLLGCCCTGLWIGWCWCWCVGCAKYGEYMGEGYMGEACVGRVGCRMERGR